MLLTNQELVTHLTRATEEGALYVESFPMPGGNMFRVQKKFVLDERKKSRPDAASIIIHFSSSLAYLHNLTNPTTLHTTIYPPVLAQLQHG